MNKYSQASVVRRPETEIRAGKKQNKSTMNRMKQKQMKSSSMVSEFNKIINKQTHLTKLKQNKWHQGRLLVGWLLGPDCKETHFVGNFVGLVVADHGLHVLQDVADILVGLQE